MTDEASPVRSKTPETSADVLAHRTSNGINNQENQNENGADIANRLILRERPRHVMETILKGGIGSVPKPGDIVEGIVIEKRGAKLFVDLGSFGTGVVYGREYHQAQDFI